MLGWTRSSIAGLLLCLLIQPMQAHEVMLSAGTIFPLAETHNTCVDGYSRARVVPPILHVDAPENYGLDSRFERAGREMMSLGTSCSVGNKEACHTVYETALAWAKADAAKRSRAKSRNDSKFWNDTLTVNLYVAAPFMAAYSFAAQSLPIETADQKTIKGWFATIVARNEHLMHGEIYKGSTQAAGTPKSAHNHALASAIAHMSLGIIAGDVRMYSNALTNWQAAVKSQRKDGSMPIETRRGGRAMFYQGRAMTALTIMAVIAENQGDDLWNYNSAKGKDFHNIVKFFVDFAEKPEIVFKYAKEMFAPGSGGGYEYQEVRESGSIFGWLAAYATRFPQHENVARIRAWSGDSLNSYQLTMRSALRSIDQKRQMADDWTVVEPICHYIR